MKIAVIGTGLMGAQLARKLADAGHEVGAHSRSTGIDLLTGEGLADATARMFAAVEGDVLTTSAHLADTHFRDWLRSR